MKSKNVSQTRLVLSLSLLAVLGFDMVNLHQVAGSPGLRAPASDILATAELEERLREAAKGLTTAEAKELSDSFKRTPEQQKALTDAQKKRTSDLVKKYKDAEDAKKQLLAQGFDLPGETTTTPATTPPRGTTNDREADGAGVCTICKTKVIDGKTYVDIEDLQKVVEQILAQSTTAKRTEAPATSHNKENETDSDESNKSDGFLDEAAYRQQQQAAVATADEKNLNGILRLCSKTVAGEKSMATTCATDEFVNLLKDSRTRKTAATTQLFQKFYEEQIEPSLVAGLASFKPNDVPQRNESYLNILKIYEKAPSSAQWLREKVLATATEFARLKALEVKNAAEQFQATTDAAQKAQLQAAGAMSFSQLGSFKDTFTTGINNSAQMAIAQNNLSQTAFNTQFQNQFAAPMNYLYSAMNGYQQILSPSAVANISNQATLLPYNNGTLPAGVQATPGTMQAQLPAGVVMLQNGQISVNGVVYGPLGTQQIQTNPGIQTLPGIQTFPGTATMPMPGMNTNLGIQPAMTIDSRNPMTQDRAPLNGTPMMRQGRY